MVRPLIVVALLGCSVAAHAQQPVEVLRTCFADRTSSADRQDLARWMFLAIAVHPELKHLASADVPTALDDSSRAMAALVTRLLTDSCATATKAALQEGAGWQSVEVAFQGLGQLAVQELLADRSVQNAMLGFVQYLDQKRIGDVLAGK